MGHFMKTINLVTENYRKKLLKSKIKRILFCFLLVSFLIVFSGFLIANFIEERILSEIDVLSNKINTADYSESQDVFNRLEQMNVIVGDFHRSYDFLDYTNKEFDILLNQLIDALGEDIYLESVRYSSSDGRLRIRCIC